VADGLLELVVLVDYITVYTPTATGQPIRAESIMGYLMSNMAAANIALFPTATRRI
jgi:hypothetical protein